MRHGRVRKLNVDKILKNNQNRTRKSKREQSKLHKEQMSRFDIHNLALKISQLDLVKTKISIHVTNKQDYRFTYRQFKEIMRQEVSVLESEIIEYNEIPVNTKDGVITDKRVLVRHKRDFDGENLCVVLSLNRNLVVTAYWVAVDDNHDFLNWDRYNNIMYISV